MDLKKTMADNLRFAREEAQLSQADVAERLGLASHSAVSAMESGNRRISASELSELGNLFEKSIDWFLNPDSGQETFFVQARAQATTSEVKTALREGEKLVKNYLFLRKLLDVN